MKEAKSMNAYNLLYYTPKLWERIVLFFCPLLTHESPGSIIWYKRFSNRMYIYGYIRATPDTYTMGSNFTENQDDTHTGSGFDNAGNN